MTRLYAIGGLANNVNTRLPAEQASETLPEEIVAIGYNDPDGFFGHKNITPTLNATYEQRSAL